MSSTQSFMRSTSSLRGHRIARDVIHVSSANFVIRSAKTNWTKLFVVDTHSSLGSVMLPSSLVGNLPSPSWISQSACWRSFVKCSSSLAHFSTRTLWWSLVTTTEFHSRDLDNAASMMSARRPCRMTGRICLKSPAISSAMPPNGFWFLITSHSVRFSASSKCLQNSQNNVIGV